MWGFQGRDSETGYMYLLRKDALYKNMLNDTWKKKWFLLLDAKSLQKKAFLASYLLLFFEVSAIEDLSFR